MKLLTLDLTTGQPVAIDKVDVDTDGNIDTLGVLETIGINFDDQAAKPAGVTTGLWYNTSNELRFYNGTDYEVMHEGVTLGGDLSGTLPSPTVAAVQGRDVQNAAPSGGDILQWSVGNNRWEPAANLPVTYYTVLTATATSAQVNTALSSFYVVFLEPGNYTNLTAVDITIPAGKSLIGLTNHYQGSTGAIGPYWTWDVSNTAQFLMAEGSLLQGIDFRFGAGSLAGQPAVFCNDTNGAMVRYCNFDSAADIASNAISGSYKVIEHVSMENCFGIQLTGAVGSSAESGTTTVRDIWWSGIAGNTASANAAVNANTGTNYVYIENIYAEVGAYAVRTDSSRYHIRNVRGSNLQRDGVWVENDSDSSLVSDIYIETAGRYGVYMRGNKFILNNVYVSAATTYGVYIDGTAGTDIDFSEISNIYVSGGAGWGFYIRNATYCTATNLYAYNTGNYGIWMEGCAQSTFSGLGAYSVSGTGTGIGISSCPDSNFTGLMSNANAGVGVYCAGDNYSVTGVTTNDNTSHGLQWIAGADNALLSSVLSYNNGGTGIITGNGGSSTNRVTASNAQGNTTDENIGTGWTEDIVPSYNLAGDVTGPMTATVVGDDTHDHTATTLTMAMDDLSDVTATGPTTYDLLQWSGGAWDARGASGDKILGTIYGTGWSGSTYEVVTSGAPLASGPGKIWRYGAATGNVFDNLLWYDAGDNNRRILTDYSNEITLPAGTTPADINTMLTNYDVVTLEPGAYACGTTALTVPSGKKLRALGDSFNSAAVLTWTGSPASRHILLQNGELENVQISLTGAAHTTTVVEGDATSDGNRCNRVYITAATSAGIYGFSGEFAEISEFTTANVNGVNLTGAPDNQGEYFGSILVTRFFIYNAPTYGINIGNVSYLNISKGQVHGVGGTTDYGIYHSDTNNPVAITVDSVNVQNVAITCFHFAHTSGNLLYHLTLNDCNAFGLNASTDRGFYLAYCSRAKLNNCWALTCNGTTGATYGSFIFVASSESRLNNCASFSANNTSNNGLYIDVNSWRCQVSNFWSVSDENGVDLRGPFSNYSDMTIYDPDVTGAALPGEYSTYSGITVYSPGAFGVVASGRWSNYSNFAAHTVTQTGIYFNGTNFSTISGMAAYDCTTYGVYIVNMVEGAVSGLAAYNSTSFGIYLASNQKCSFSSLRTSEGGNHGITLDGNHYSSFSSLTSYNDGDGGTESGIYVTNHDYATFTGLTAYSAYYYGIIFTGGCSYCTGSAIGAYASGNRGVFFDNAPYCQFGDINAQNNSSWGISAGTNSTYTQLSGLNARGNTTWDVLLPSMATANVNNVVGYMGQAGKISVNGHWRGAGGVTS